MRNGVIAAFGLLAALLSVPGQAGVDRLGDTLPAGAVQRLGTTRMCYGQGVSDLCYLPDGRGVVTVGNSVELWDLAEGVRESVTEIGEAGLTSVVPRRDGKELLLADADGAVHEWDVSKRRVSRSWPTGQKQLRRAVYSPDETRVLTTGTRPPTLKEWELATGGELVAVTGTMHAFREGIYGPGGKTAFVDGANGSGPILACYDLATGKPLREWLKDYYAHGRSMLLSTDGTRLLVGSRHKATEWQVDGYKQLKKFTGHHGHAVTSVAYCRDPEQILTGSRDGSIRRWNRLTGKVLLRWVPHNGHVTRIAVSPDGKWALSYGARVMAECSLATGAERVTWERHSGAVQAVAFLPDKRRVVSASADGTLRLWDARTGLSERVIKGARLGAYAVAVSPDGAAIATGCKDGSVREFSVSDGARLRALKGHFGYVRAVTYTPDGARLLSSAGDGTVCVWRKGDTTPALRLEGHQGGVLAVAVSDDSGLALSGGRDGTVRFWDLAAGKLLHTFTGHHSWVGAVAFAPGRRHAVSAGQDGRVLKWDLENRALAAEMTHPGAATAVACSPAGTRVYSAGAEGALVCWDLRTGRKLFERTGHQRAVNGLALSADGALAATASSDTTLLVWQAVRSAVE